MKIFLSIFTNFLLIISIVYADEKFIVTAESGLILRDKPGKGSTKLITMPYKESVEVIDKNGPKEKIAGINAKWYKIKYKGKTGWAFSAFISKDDESATNEISCSKIAGQYNTVSESEWDYVLFIQSDCSYKLNYKTHYFDDYDKYQEKSEDESGSIKISGKNITLINSKSEKKEFIYHKTLSQDEFGGSGSSQGVIRKNKKISFWRFPKNK